MPVDVEVENRKLVQEVNSLKAQVVALQQELAKERAANKEKEQLLLKRELDLESQKQNLSDERSRTCTYIYNFDQIHSVCILHMETVSEKIIPTCIFKFFIWMWYGTVY